MAAKNGTAESRLTPLLHSFPPVAGPDARLLVLGSMPGQKSLDEQQYYAHPRNLFWPIMGDLVGAHPALPYNERLAALTKARIALWDVLQSCTRRTSLDSDIREEAPNDLHALLQSCPAIKTIAFNGRKAEQSFRRHFPALTTAGPRLISLPSTSPAYAAMTFETKRKAWQTAVDGLA